MPLPGWGWWAKGPAEQPAPEASDVEDGSQHKRCRFCFSVCEVCKEKAVDLDPEALAQAVRNAVALREAAARHRQRQLRNGQGVHVMVPISLASLAMPPADEVVEPQPCVTWALCPNAFLNSSWNERQAARSTILLLSVVLGLGLAVLIVNQT